MIIYLSETLHRKHHMIVQEYKPDQRLDFSRRKRNLSPRLSGEEFQDMNSQAEFALKKRPRESSDQSKTFLVIKIGY